MSALDIHSPAQSLARYPAYKDSGIDWIGEIPEHWEVQRGKWLFIKNERPVLPHYEVITCFRDGTVTLRKNRREEGFTNSILEIGYQGVLKGDLVIHQMDAFAGAIGVSDSNGKSSPVYSVCSPRIPYVDCYYYAYLLRIMAFKGVIKSLAKGIRERSTDFRFNDFANLIYCFPPLSEQAAIAEFLDKKCEQIDRLIRIKEQQIERLQELRQAKIHRAVTKGLNPNVPLKDSGIEWIGEIPEHWEVYKLTHLFEQVGSGTTPTSSNSEYYEKGTFSFLQTGDLNDGYVNKTEKKITEHAIRKFSTLKLYPQGSLVIAMYGATIGKLGILNIPSYTNQACCVLRRANEDKVISKFVFYWFLFAKNNIISLSYGGGQPNISQELIKSLRLQLPPLSEQAAIAEFLDKVTKQIDQTINHYRNQIEKLKEYKQSLIDAAVTGKIKVT